MREQLLFADLSPTQLARVQASSVIEVLEPGQVLYERDQPARHFFLVLEGQMNLALHSRGGDEKIVEIITSGHVFAEAVMFLAEPSYQLTAVAAVRTRLARFDSATYLAAIAESPATCLRMLGHMSRRLHGRIRDIEHLSFESATFRLARLLLNRLPPGDGPLELRLNESRQELAAYLSMKPETLSRSLRTLVQSGVIEVAGRVLHVASRARLAAAVESAK
jgi:CRP-like cAMP-binding protein